MTVTYYEIKRNNIDVTQWLINPPGIIKVVVHY